MEIKIGKSYSGKSGCVKKITGIGKDQKTVDYTVTKQGTGKGNHPPVHFKSTQSMVSFQKWVTEEV